MPAAGPGLIAVAAPGELEGEIMAWRNLLWDSVRMLQAGRPDLAGRFRTAAAEIERRVKPLQQAQCRSAQQ